jgi:ABC-type uncharacterized transport system substrate-binding protein
MKRRRFIVGVGAILTAPLIAEGQSPAVPIVGILAPGGRPEPGRPGLAHLAAFREALRDLGYVEGRTIALEVRWDDNKPDRLPPIAAEFVRRGVNIILAGGTAGTVAAKQATGTIPIVMAASGVDPVQLGLVASVARPGGNVTGMMLQTHELPGKRLELLRMAAPETTRVTVLWNPFPGSHALVKDHQAAAHSLGVQLQALEVRTLSDLDDAFVTGTRTRAQAVMMTQGAFFTIHRTRIAELALRNRLPTISGETGYAQAGGLMDYGPNIVESWRRSAVFVDKILKGAKPGDLPIEQPQRFELVINLKTAKALGVTIAPSLLLRADQVIE